MHIGRRSFVFLALAIPIWARAALAAPIGGRSSYPLTALGPYLDILIPRDETGSATDLGIHRRLVNQARRDRQRMRLLRGGCKWLDFEARARGAGGFTGLDPAAQEAIVARAAGARDGSLPRAFFDTTRDAAVRAYYAEPAVWGALGYRGPPQPAGYMDHAGPPR